MRWPEVDTPVTLPYSDQTERDLARWPEDLLRIDGSKFFCGWKGFWLSSRAVPGCFDSVNLFDRSFLAALPVRKHRKRYWQSGKRL